ncbi:T9SS type A sorting domain-containing protein [Nibribacter ruber]|uniref:T9SS type A sorting domain-containing protein n=1 Tax=Nibribacter ruber TaxID=2698458 RepID=A0A6P1P2D1_9BACT|nr:T9SS type A sorting domain-containing protein [Nibribacter ruber]QHL88566.1 T9SS type A sorting domain-containing protein [Nibribacter ruber]
MKHLILLVIVCLSFYQLPAQVRKNTPLPADVKVEAKAEAEARSVNVFPNPTNGVINISLEGFEGKKTELRILNVIGNIVYREVVPDPSSHFVKSVDLDKLAKGLYYVKLDAEEYSEVRKVILR